MTNREVSQVTTVPRVLSKSKLLALRQCERRLWLEVHRPDLRADSAATEKSFQIGHAVGDTARRLYDPAGAGTLVDVQAEGFPAALQRSMALLQSTGPLFEVGYSAGGALAFADIMLRTGQGRDAGWRMVEVKAATEVKDYHRDDTAVQAFVARSAGVPLKAIALARIDSKWVYPGGDDYQGLLVEEDLTDEAFGREAEVRDWIAAGQSVVRQRTEPAVATGAHCGQPYACGFHDYCRAQEPVAAHPVEWLPRVQTKVLKALLEQPGILDLAQIDDALLNDKQLRVKTHTLANSVYFDAPGAAAALQPHRLPACFIDFETVQFAVPIWAGTRPYQQIPFQFSAHRLGANGELTHQGFLDLSGADPSLRFATALLAACGESGPVFVYNKGFESARINELAERFPRHGPALRRLSERLVDLLPIAAAHYYHPSQQGSWSIKRVLPAMVPELSYDHLAGVQEGGAAVDAYVEATHPATPPSRKAELEAQLLAYCRLDTFAMIRIWSVLAGRADLRHLPDCG
ncbi:MAG: DUF2779 domain-containing protein [Betaproteobacteria bacterium]|nr:DUF2779 domain-containing protein [Betaproteobacteria bacterium]